MAANLGSKGRAALLVLFAGLALAAPARALVIANGDLVGVFVKNGFEVVVNLGPATPGAPMDLAGTVDVAEFGGSLAGARFVGLAVENPGRTVSCCGGTFPLENIVYTSQIHDPMPTDIEIEAAMNRVDSANPTAAVWFQLLRQLPGTDSELIQSTELFSYELVLGGGGTDAVDNRFTFSTAGVFDGQERLEIALFSATRGYEAFGGPAAEYTEILNLAFDGTQVEFQPAPEASAALGTLVGGTVLAALSRRRRKRTFRD
jgi:hypothetical protein